MKLKATKAWLALAGALVTGAGVAVADNVITLNEVADFAQLAVLAIGTFLTALGVYNVPNDPK